MYLFFYLQTEPGDTLAADHSLPIGLVLGESTIIGAGTGVFTEERFERGARFGPYRGEIISKYHDIEAHESGYSWLVSA